MDFDQNNIKQSFTKVKEDINFLNNEILNLKLAIEELKNIIIFQKNTSTDRQTDTSTLRQINTTLPATTTHNTTVPQEIQGFKPLNLTISTGNEGVSTDRQTDTSTDRHIENSQFSTYSPTHFLEENTQKSIESNIKEASEILESLDHLKKEIRLKFKRVTPQEMSVFSTIYQLEEQNLQEVTYRDLSKRLSLSESSIRDYVQRMMNKGIPIKKQKLNNKKITLSISKDLKRIATLPTIISLREL